ncbi:hypothetical protein NEOLEDRAFT_967421 [Neolentinus lepideus HHB14362 ss-1]|uniref:Uncharacterized protein n=1 Tax=Neolentinus lepideus HHB14362 ss-1 TaxID=1314782 RepID=A0A165NCS8_9AGAM|nr:hypothetical protein NEOLEDRAFT_967421 [Neolentinus lepideus HHB14362 ss-1]
MDSTPSIAASAKGKAKASLSMLKPRSPSPSPGPSQAYVVEPKINMSVPARDNVSPIDTLLHRKMRDKTPAPGATGDISDDDDVPRIPASAKGKGKALPLRSPSPPPSDKATRTSLRRTSKTKATSQQESVRAPAKNRKRKRVSNESTVTLERGDGVSFSRLASASSSPERNYDGYASLSGEASGEDSDPQPPRPFPKSRSRSRAPSRARSHAPVFPLPFPRDPSSQPASGHDLTTQAHFVLAQAMQHLSYLISTTPAPAAPPPGWAPTNFPPVASYPFPQGPWSPQTPSNHRRSRSRYRSVAPTQSSSSPTRPRSSSAFATPVHSYDPAYSGATLPPSSSPASSPESSSDLDFEKMRPQSARYASPSKDRSPSKGKARGRMVSFKLAEDVSPVRQGRKGKEREKSDEDENENE